MRLGLTEGFCQGGGRLLSCAERLLQSGSPCKVTHPVLCSSEHMDQKRCKPGIQCNANVSF